MLKTQGHEILQKQEDWLEIGGQRIHPDLKDKEERQHIKKTSLGSKSGFCDTHPRVQVPKESKMMHANNTSYNNRRNVNGNVEDGFITTSNGGNGSTDAAVMNTWSNTSTTANSSSCCWNYTSSLFQGRDVDDDHHYTTATAAAASPAASFGDIHYATGCCHGGVGGGDACLA